MQKVHATEAEADQIFRHSRRSWENAEGEPEVHRQRWFSHVEEKEDAEANTGVGLSRNLFPWYRYFMHISFLVHMYGSCGKMGFSFLDKYLIKCRSEMWSARRQ
eukprot:TRINITY_DN10567_c0_g1_i1.p1 TRINITY_DN10567_c0_g1~~TRINITY_DN10567_c0_g1_i1.p1  ORF type:complete len:104 (-),score=12.72 TRINITY_DN10567_c0_g1_i1:92-403(-)